MIIELAPVPNQDSVTLHAAMVITAASCISGVLSKPRVLVVLLTSCPEIVRLRPQKVLQKRQADTFKGRKGLFKRTI